ncbi:MAG: DNA-binding response regulator [Clostridiales bacterium]|jgi:DNA-binding NarL/FixJ family response regulator|nr:DNA-binding response regulator [Clostridiales bacterium]
MKPILIAIADDQLLFRESIKTVLNLTAGLKVVATAANGEEACQIAETFRPNVLLLDIRMPGMDGIECISHVRRCSPDTKILMLTTFNEDQYIVAALASGASGFLLKEIEVPKLVEAIFDAAAGKTILPQEITAALAKYLSGHGASSEAHNDKHVSVLASLTTREQEIARMLSQGFTNHQIASALYLSEGTVRNFLSSIYAKLHVKDRTQAALYLKELFSEGVMIL